MLKTTAALSALLALALLGPAAAETPEEKGLRLAQETEARDDGFGDSSTLLSMVLRDAQGRESTRALRIQTMETDEEGAGDRSLTIFDSPRDIEGTAFLSYTKILDPDDQYRTHKVEFYDRKDELLKTLVNGDYREYLGRYWRAHELEMTNHQTGKSTTLRFDDYAFQEGVDDAYFNPNRLSRIR